MTSQVSSNFISPVDALRSAVNHSIASLLDDGAEVESRISLERPPRLEMGDYSTNAALVIAPLVKMKPREVANKLKGLLEQNLGEELERIEIAGPGFVNLFLSDRWNLNALDMI